MSTLAPSRRTVRDRLLPWGTARSRSRPHTDVDRYLELVHPLLDRPRTARVEVDEGRPQRPPTAVTLTLRPTRQWQGFRAGQFVQRDASTSTGYAESALLLPEPARSTAATVCIETHHQGARRTAWCRSTCIEQRPSRPGDRAVPGGRRRSTLPVQRRPTRVLLDQRRQRHHARAVDAALARATRALRRRDRVPALRRLGPQHVSPTATTCARSTAAHDNVRLVLAVTAAQDDGDDTARPRSSTAHLDEIAPVACRDAADLSLRPARALMAGRTRGVRRPRPGATGCSTEEFAAGAGTRRCRATTRSLGDRSPSTAAGRAHVQRPAPPCSNRPKPAGLSRQNTAAAWASASRARRSRPAAAPATSAPARPIATPTPRSSCASACPVGDVALNV